MAELILDSCIEIQPVMMISLIFHTLLTGNYRDKINLPNVRYLNINILLSGVPDFFDRNKILSGGDLSHYQVPHCIRVFFYFVWFVFIHHNFQFYFKLCTYCNILNIYLS